jgi:hypothetical protein
MLLTERGEFLTESSLVVLTGSQSSADYLSIGAVVESIADSAQKMVVEVLALLVSFLILKVDVVAFADIDLN